MRIQCYLIVLFGLIFSCKPKDESTSSSEYHFTKPNGFSEPLLRDDNPMTRAKIALGQKLFFEPMLSRDSSISCGSCHKQEFAYTDPQAISFGVDDRLGIRNAPTLSNLAWYPYFFVEGGSPNLESQILGPIEDPNEMDFSILLAVQRLKENISYQRAFMEVFGEAPSVYNTTRAIAAFERDLVSANSKYDKYSNNEKIVYNDTEKQGLALFESARLNCSACHSPPLFTNFKFENNGLELEYSDPGRARLSLAANDSGKFKVPTIRNIEVTGPYMHDGRFSTLEQIIDHYENGIQNHRNLSPKIKNFQLTNEEREALLIFLKSLTDHEFIGSKDY